MLNTVRGSTEASRPPATGRSNVTVTASVASPSLSGVTRSTRSGSTDTTTAPSVSKTAVRTENIDATRGGDCLNLPAIGGSGAQRSREDAEPRALSLTPWLRPVQNDEGDPREPAHPLAPAQRPQHQPRLRDRRLPRGVRPLEQRHRAGEHVVRPVPVRGGVGHVPDAGRLPPAVVVAGPGDEEVVPGGQLEHVAAGGGREGEPPGSAVHDLEAVHAGCHERVQVLPVVVPVFRE